MTQTADHGELGVLVSWSLTLTEPLLSLRQRATFADNLAKLHHQHPKHVQRFWAGIISDLIRTLPSADPWLHLSARVDQTTVGPQPPEGNSGAVTADRTSFGTWHDAVDLVPLFYASPHTDPGLCALADDDLHPHAAAILASGAHGWHTCAEMIAAVHRHGSDSFNADGVIDMITRESWRAGAALLHTMECAVAACRWATFRRRGYMGFEDEWVRESPFRWAWRVTRDLKGLSWSDADVERAIKSELIRQPAPQDREPDLLPGDF